VEGDPMSALQLDETGEEVVGLRIERRRGWAGAGGVRRESRILRMPLRRWPAAPALSARSLLTEFPRRRFPQVLHEPVRLVFPKLCQRCDARGDGEDFGFDGLPTADVVRRVAHDQDLVTPQILMEQPAAALARDGGDLIALLVVVAKCAGLEDLPEIEVAQLDFRTQTDVSGQEANDGWLRQRAKLAQEMSDTGNDPALGSGEEIIEPKNVAVEKPAGILRARLNPVLEKELPGERRVGPTGELQTLGPIREIELGGERAGERFHASAARANQRAVNVEQNQSDHGGEGTGSRRVRQWRARRVFLPVVSRKRSEVRSPKCEWAGRTFQSKTSTQSCQDAKA